MEFTNQLKKYVRSLHTSKHRQKYNKFIAEGPKICEEFLISPQYELEYIFCLTEWYDENRRLIEGIDQEKIIQVKEKELGQISCLKTAHKVLLVIDKSTRVNTDIDEGWQLYLDKIQDPGNMGTLLRIADWYGLSTVSASEGSVDFYNPKVVQAAMGAHNRVRLISLSSANLLKASVPKYGLVLEGEDINLFQPDKPGFIMIGNESKGLSKELIQSLDAKLKIPAKGKAESLNASVACGIACHLLTNKL